MAGTLYLVATPIGNLEDITLRALRVLGEVDLIACEDTRRTQKLLTHYKISKPVVSYHEHNERQMTVSLSKRLAGGTCVALVSDAGMPLVSDPGYRLVSEAISRGIRVVPVPGASALTAALAASGLPANEFTFAGFLPSRRGARRARLAELARSNSTLIFYEAPHRIVQVVSDAREVLGDREAAIARELTKIHEEFIRGRLSEIGSRFSDRAPLGEFVLLIAPPSGGEVPQPVELSISEEVEEIMQAEGLDQKGALKRVARARGISKSEAYRLLMADQVLRELRGGKGRP